MYLYNLFRIEIFVKKIFNVHAIGIRTKQKLVVDSGDTHTQREMEHAVIL